ncbi:MAG: C-GCAxxG-C-C family protein [Desulfovibrionaceae bacterium]
MVDATAAGATVTPGERARELFASGFFCAESVLKAVAEAKGIASEYIPGVATGFCSGVSRTQDRCGALSGAVMAVGLIYGRREPDETVDDCYMRTIKLVRRFKERFGSLDCTTLCGHDLSTEEGRAAFKERDAKARVCLGLAAAATEMALELLDA